MSENTMDNPNQHNPGSSGLVLASAFGITQFIMSVCSFVFDNVDTLTKIISCTISVVVGIYAIRYYRIQIKKAN